VKDIVDWLIDLQRMRNIVPDEGEAGSTSKMLDIA
jgi:hypothetical protein